MAKQSLFQACKRVFRDGISGTYEVGTKDIFLELYGQEDIDGGVEIGNSSEENIVVVAGDSITIPSGYTLTPMQPKKSLVIICNTFENNGTVSMYQKAPNVLPHDLFIIDKNSFGGSKDVIIPAYAENQVTKNFGSDKNGANGNAGTNRQCGSGGTGSGNSQNGGYNSTSGSGYAFGGGAGSGGFKSSVGCAPISVDSTYPMRGSNANGRDNSFYSGGVGNPVGSSHTASGYSSTSIPQGVGCGGRIIVFCKTFENNGNITVNGTSTIKINSINDPYSGAGCAWGGASGAGAVDLFYTTLAERGTITANGGDNFTSFSTPGKGGNGSITLTPWSKSAILKPIEKYMSKENMVYFLNQYVSRLAGGED